MESGQLIKKNKRIWELDFLRGLCVLLMVWDHFMYDSAYLFGEAWISSGNGSLIGLNAFALKYMNGGLRETFHPVIFNLFFVICGISCIFSKNNLLRGVEAMLLALGITAVTFLINNGEAGITFGVLHMLSIAILIWWAINVLCRRKRYITAAVSLILGIILLCSDLIIGKAGVEANQDLFFISEQFGGSYGSMDYFPIIPHAGAVLLGAAFGAVVYKKKKSLLPFLDKYGWYKPVGYVGRVALWVYVLHQVVIGAVLALVSYFVSGDFVII